VGSGSILLSGWRGGTRRERGDLGKGIPQGGFFLLQFNPGLAEGEKEPLGEKKKLREPYRLRQGTKQRGSYGAEKKGDFL